MGELPFFRAHTALHPDHLWIWEKAVYVDENQRTWLPVTIEVQPLWGQARGAAWASHPWPGLWSRVAPGCAGPGGAPHMPQGEGGGEAQKGRSTQGGRGLTDETTLR